MASQDSTQKIAREIFDELTPRLIGIADKLRRVIEDPLPRNVGARAMLLRAAAEDLESLWRYIAGRAEIERER